jgi:hypothetical protein
LLNLDDRGEPMQRMITARLLLDRIDRQPFQVPRHPA